VLLSLQAVAFLYIGLSENFCKKCKLWGQGKHIFGEKFGNKLQF